MIAANESHYIFTGRLCVEEILDLRHRILRPGLPIETASFPGDEELFSQHFGAWYENNGSKVVIGCATVMLNEYEGRTAWQLRGMATDDAYRGLGVGRKVLAFTEIVVRDCLQQVDLMWCNAREVAISFYEKNGWHCTSDLFDIPTAGPHRKMVKVLPSIR